MDTFSQMAADAREAEQEKRRQDQRVAKRVVERHAASNGWPSEDQDEVLQALGVKDVGG